MAVTLDEQGYIRASSTKEVIIKYFFGALTDTYFLQDISYLLHGIGLGKEVLSCNFPDPNEEGEKREKTLKASNSSSTSTGTRREKNSLFPPTSFTASFDWLARDTCAVTSKTSQECGRCSPK